MLSHPGAVFLRNFSIASLISLMVNGWSLISSVICDASRNLFKREGANFVEF